MKKLKVLFTITMALFFSINCSSTIYACATSVAVQEPYVRYSIEFENDSALNDATLLSTNTYIENGRAITETIYEQPDGTIITDILNVSAIASRSKEGTDTATRTRTINNWGSITITASFRWYTKGLFSYVKCTSMSAYHSLNSKVCVSKWNTDYTQDYVSIGKAKAEVEYYFYNSEIPFQYQEVTFKITCSDSGTISDNN